MNKNKIYVAPYLLETLVGSTIVNEREKLRVLKYVGYMTYKEQLQLSRLL